MGMELEQDPLSVGLTEEGILHIPGLLSRWVRLENGALAHYVTSGETGPAVILLHGGIDGSSGTAGWRFMAPFLGASGFRVYAPDRPGFGLADTSKREYLEWNNKAQIDFIRMFADALGIEQFHISGNSMGCVHAYQFLLNHPERVLSAAFIAGALGDIVEASYVATKDSQFASNPGHVDPPYDGTAESMKTLMEGIIYEPKAIWPELIEMRVIAANKQIEARRGLEQERHTFMVGPDTPPNTAQLLSSKNRIDKLTTPMICLYGLQDVSVPVENGFNQDDAIPNIQFFFPDECGHQGQTDQPDMFNTVFLEFFRDGKVTWDSAQWAGVSRRKPINPELVEQPPAGFPAPDRSLYDSLEKLRAGLGRQVRS